ncbi:MULTISPECIES: response regulator transcription factor [unclassified Pseudofrankia]|uniref:LuxR C-terminal-related transcriptional regulator n=1 Tax=unclassified Pseudofrankia TaxID=2994372 RepID=UPI0008D939DC|nr:DNA-binding response regulator [Pseudofrankia sp. BMG5.36]
MAAVRECRRLRLDVVLMDIRMPVMDGLEATRVIAADTTTAQVPALDAASTATARPESRDTGGAQDVAKPRILVVTTFDDDEYVFGALRAGAAGFILKDTQPELLVTAIRTVAAGDSLLAPGITRRLIAEFARRPHPATGRGPDAAGLLSTLTERERAVLTHVANGYSNAEIAQALDVGVSTVKTHISHLLVKLAARDRAQLVIAAYETGLIAPGDRTG